MTKVIIAGAGTVGPLLALALKRVGFSPVLYEAAKQITNIGGGFNLAPNGLRVVQRLGLLDQVYKEGAPLDTAHILTLDGKRVTSFSGKKIEEKYGIRNTGILRSRFLEIAHKACAKEKIPMHLNKRLISISQTDKDVTATFEDGTKATGDLLFGCDGLRSRSRQALFGEDKPVFTGIHAIIGVTDDVARFGYKHNDTSIFQGKGLQLGCYGLGHGQVVWFLGQKGEVETAQERWDRGAAEDESSLRQQIIDKVQRAGTVKVFSDIIGGSKYIFKYAINDRDTLPTWSKGRCTLVGDAAHPMPPHLGQGANTAMEDCGTIWELFKRLPHEDYAKVFSVYEELRLKRTAGVMEASRKMGPMNSLEDPWLCWLRDRAIAAAVWVYGGPPVGDMYRWDYAKEVEKALQNPAPKK